MFDSFNRRIDYLRISVTGRCNLRCVYCANDDAEESAPALDALSSSELGRFVSLAVKLGVRKIRLTGGEPLLRPDIIPLVSEAASSGVRDLSMTTNGLLLAPMAKPLKKAGLRRVNISMDTLDHSKYRAMTRGGDIARVWEAIEAAEGAGLTPVKINVVTVRGWNDDEALDFASLTFERDFHIRFIELMPTGKAGAVSGEKAVTKAELIEKISALGGLELMQFKGGGPSRNYRLKGARGVIGFISPLSDCFCEHCNRLRLTSEGKLRPCLFSDAEIDVKAALGGGAPDDEIEALILRAAGMKPEGHTLNGQPDLPGLPLMSKVGG